jgi:D-arabinose 1-dehydrogenase-like Zn-dependent alcohol dehydrogenase
MKAAVLRSFGSPLDVSPIADPTPGRGEVLVRVRAVGLCATDLKVVDGVLPGLQLPLVPGHEVAGEVVAGEADDIGLHVACYLYEPCGECRWCRSGAHALCPRAGRLGRSRNGGLAEYVVLRRENALPFKDIDFAKAAVAMDAVATPWRALRVRAELASGETIVIAGAGGLGLNAVQIARDLGASVAVLDPDEAARVRASELGAELTVHPSDVSQVIEWSAGGADVGLESSGSRAGFDSLVAGICPGGRVVCCGYLPGTEYGLDSMRLVLSEIAVVGSRASSREDARRALAAVEAGRIAPDVTRRLPIEDVNEGLALVRKGGLAGRVVIEP